MYNSSGSSPPPPPPPPPALAGGEGSLSASRAAMISALTAAVQDAMSVRVTVP